MITITDILTKLTKVFTLISLRYLLFAGALYFVFYVWKKRHFIQQKIQAKYPSRHDILREIGYSMSTILMFAIVSSLLFLLRKNGYTKVYKDFHEHSIAYFVFTIVAFIVVHDAYFYWMHRFMHWKKIYKYVHKVHHLSTNPTPWAAFAFHPLEAIIEIGILPIMVFAIPIHPFAILSWVLFQTGMNVLGHLGFELFPKGFTKNTVTQFSNTSTHHNMHHRYVNCNYGLYFNYWDRWMNTNHAQYHEQFDAVTSQKATQKEIQDSSLSSPHQAI
jgi:lathosterol oxidase